MAFVNGGFELGTGVIGVAQDWVSASVCASALAGFGDDDSAYETFKWGDVISDTSTWLIAPFGGSIPGFETFDWGGEFTDEWNAGWINSTPLETFDWDTFNDVMVAGNSTPVEDFIWSTFDDIFHAGASTPVEDFEAGW